MGCRQNKTIKKCKCSLTICDGVVNQHDVHNHEEENVDGLGARNFLKAKDTPSPSSVLRSHKSTVFTSYIIDMLTNRGFSFKTNNQESADFNGKQCLEFVCDHQDI